MHEEEEEQSKKEFIGVHRGGRNNEGIKKRAFGVVDGRTLRRGEYIGR